MGVQSCLTLSIHLLNSSLSASFSFSSFSFLVIKIETSFWRSERSGHLGSCGKQPPPSVQSKHQTQPSPHLRTSCSVLGRVEKMGAEYPFYIGPIGLYETNCIGKRTEQIHKMKMQRFSITVGFLFFIFKNNQNRPRILLPTSTHHHSPSNTSRVDKALDNSLPRKGGKKSHPADFWSLSHLAQCISFVCLLLGTLGFAHSIFCL